MIGLIQGVQIHVCTQPTDMRRGFDGLSGMVTALLEQESFLPKSLIGKAATYTRNQWSALNRYVEHGDLSIHNNFAERAMRPIAIGRKNWLFVGSEQAGHRAVVLTSLMASCKNNHVEPWAYLKAEGRL